MKLNQSLYYRLHRETEKQTVIPNPQSGSMMRYVNGKEENQVWGVAGKPTRQIIPNFPSPAVSCVYTLE